MNKYLSQNSMSEVSYLHVLVKNCDNGKQVWKNGAFVTDFCLIKVNYMQYGVSCVRMQL